jgi:MFS family permease
MGGWPARVVSEPRRWGVDLAPLRVSPAYRRLFVISTIQTLTAQAAYVTMMYQLKILTHSTWAVGALGLVEFFPTLIFGLYGGVIADRFRRERVALWTELGYFALVGLLWWNAHASSPSVATIYVLAAAMAVLGGIQSPSLNALTQQLVPHNLQREAATVEIVQGTGGSIIGPAIGGVVAVVFGPQFVYGAYAVSLAATSYLLVGLKIEHRPNDDAHNSLASFTAGARYAWSRPDIVGTYVVDLLAMTLAYPVALLPFVAGGFHEWYALALLYCGLPTGALLATLFSRWTRRVHHYGRAVAIAAAVWGVGVVVFGLADSLPLALAGLVLGGGADAVSGIFRMTMWNESIPTQLRGRMAGIEMLSFSLGPTAGQSRAGLMAALTTKRVAIVSGGLACVGACALLPAGLRSLWNFDARTDANVALVRTEREEDHLG